MTPILDADGRPFRVAERRPIQARHVTRQAIWTQETEREIRAQHSADGRHGGDLHLIGMLWFRQRGPSLPIEISPASFFRERVQGTGALWSGVNDAGWGSGLIQISGMPVDYSKWRMSLRNRNLDFRFQNNVVHAPTANAIVFSSLYGGTGEHHYWLQLKVYGDREND